MATKMLMEERYRSLRDPSAKYRPFEKPLEIKVPGSKINGKPKYHVQKSMENQSASCRNERKIGVPA